MNNLIAHTLGAFLLGLVACSDGSSVPPPPFERTVQLEGAIGVSTRSVIGSGYEKDLEVSFARQDETAASAGSYGAWSVHKAVRQGGRGNRPILFSVPQSYPADGRSIRLHGFYPAAGEVGGEVSGEVSSSEMSTGKVSFVLDGTTDIMSTGIFTASGYTPAQTCTFRHLLTQVRLVCYSDDPEAWGTIKTIEAVDVHTRQALDLAEATPHLKDISLDEEIKNLPVADIAGLSIPELPNEEADLPAPQGYLLLPVSPMDGTAGHPLHLRITTTKDGRGVEVETVSDVSVYVEGGFRPGQSHAVTLFFTGSSAILTTSVSVTPWAEYEQGEMPI